MPAYSLSTLRSRAREHADQVDSTFITDATLTGWVNNALDKLYGMIVTVWEDYYLTRVDASFTGASYTLPSDFFKLVRVGVKSASGPFRQLQRCMASEEDYYAAATGLQPEQVRYQLEGQRLLRFLPGFANTVDAKLAYIPLRTQLVEDEDTFDAPQGWEEWAVLNVAVRMVSKAEQNTMELRTQLAEETERIRREAPKRDTNQVARVQDTTTLANLQPGDPYWWTA